MWIVLSKACALAKKHNDYWFCGLMLNIRNTIPLVLLQVLDERHAKTLHNACKVILSVLDIITLLPHTLEIML